MPSFRVGTSTVGTVNVSRDRKVPWFGHWKEGVEGRNDERGKAGRQEGCPDVQPLRKLETLKHL